jgi:hypothetical protein
MSIASGGISIHDLEYSHAFSTLPTITVQPFPSFWWGIRSPTLSGWQSRLMSCAPHAERSVRRMLKGGVFPSRRVLHVPLSP